MKIFIGLVIIFVFALMISALGVNKFGSLSSKGKAKGGSNAQGCSGDCSSCIEKTEDCEEDTGKKDS